MCNSLIDTCSILFACIHDCVKNVIQNTIPSSLLANIPVFHRANRKNRQNIPGKKIFPPPFIMPISGRARMPQSIRQSPRERRSEIVWSERESVNTTLRHSDAYDVGQVFCGTCDCISTDVLLLFPMFVRQFSEA